MNRISLNDITIHKFRGLREVYLQDLGMINLLVGVNNSGKTSVLEALSIYCHPLDIRAWFNTARQREQDQIMRYTSTLDSLQWLFTREVSTDPLELKAGTIQISSHGLFPIQQMLATCEQIEGLFLSEKDERNKALVSEEEDQIDEGNDVYVERKGLDLQIKLNTNQINLFDDQEADLSDSFQFWEHQRLSRIAVSRKGPSLMTTIVTPTSHRSEIGQFRLLSDASFQNFKSDVVDLLHQMDNNISGIDILLPPDAISSSRFQIYIQHEKLGLAPISTFGDGVRRLLHIALKLASVKGGILLIDELESTIHTEALQSSFQWLVKWCKEMNVQLFATTHSLEAVDALLDVTEDESDLVFYRLESQESKTQVIRHNRNRLRRLREDLGQEVRW